MEATGIYWIPVYEHFEKEGFDVSLVNGAHAKNVPGRKTDVLDSEWLRELHTYGLLRASFIPEAEIRELRYYVRLRDDHIAMGATHINIIQKNLDMMNIKLHKVIDSVMSKSGLLIVRAILDGVRNPEKLWELCQEYITDEKRQGVIDSLKGNYRKEYLLVLARHYKCGNNISLCKILRQRNREVTTKMTIEFEDPQNLSTPKRMKQTNRKLKTFTV